MRLVGRKRLTDFATKHPPARGLISAWVAEVEAAQWKRMQDIKDRYPGASILEGNRVIFNLGGNKYRLEVVVAFGTATVVVSRVGTHKEYDRWK